MAQNFVGSAMINIWMDGVSLGFVIWLLLYLNVRLAWISLIIEVPFYVAVIRNSVAEDQGDQSRLAGSGRGIFGQSCRSGSPASRP